MTKFYCLVEIETETSDQAAQVVEERIGYEDDEYGFDYNLKALKLIQADSWGQTKMGGVMHFVFPQGSTVFSDGN